MGSDFPSPPSPIHPNSYSPEWHGFLPCLERINRDPFQWDIRLLEEEGEDSFFLQKTHLTHQVCGGLHFPASIVSAESVRHGLLRTCLASQSPMVTNSEQRYFVPLLLLKSFSFFNSIQQVLHRYILREPVN